MVGKVWWKDIYFLLYRQRYRKTRRHRWTQEENIRKGKKTERDRQAGGDMYSGREEEKEIKKSYREDGQTSR